VEPQFREFPEKYKNNFKYSYFYEQIKNNLLLDQINSKQQKEINDD